MVYRSILVVISTLILSSTHAQSNQSRIDSVMFVIPVQFDFASEKIRDDSKPYLTTICQRLIQHKNQKIVLVLYEKADLNLSVVFLKRRLRAVKKFLVDCGVPDHRVEMKGYEVVSESHPPHLLLVAFVE